jgi:hypothetical protein
MGSIQKSRRLGPGTDWQTYTKLIRRLLSQTHPSKHFNHKQRCTCVSNSEDMATRRRTRKSEVRRSSWQPPMHMHDMGMQLPPSHGFSSFLSCSSGWIFDQPTVITPTHASLLPSVTPGYCSPTFIPSELIWFMIQPSLRCRAFHRQLPKQ